MDESLLEIRSYEGEGYQPLVDFGSWRVAILRFEDGLLPGQQRSMERHMQTDEVFVLTKGAGMLILGGNDSQVGTLALQPMEIGSIYNIKRCAWHTLSLSTDASVVIVENRDTTVQNSEYADLTQEQRQALYALLRG
jgi:oxalate decarboxylase/phosphoglucose isomerase-like protein (cupin superfamily)